MLRRSNHGNENRVPHRGAGAWFALTSLATIISGAGIEGIGNPADSTRNTIMLGGLALISFLGMKANVEAIPEPAPALPLMEYDPNLTPPIVEGAAAHDLETLLWLAETGQRPISPEAEAIRAANVAAFNEG